MGCGASTGTVKNGCATSTVRVPQSFPKPPQNLPPDQATHQLYVRELNMFLINVARNPDAFVKRVERGREIRFAELSMETGMHRAVCAENGWLFVGP
ncbi:atpH [Symbiodinium necroappetens]|uniref:AtpH protein n=1 Tax=Symbiodinium necroappetens TaxID=1628268 RepID=A0A813BSH2_9DINO|nr:atpH [Symbiodinium necroappetens]